jgi:glycine cleavage system P protein (glycine dehydrogenase) subunit 1
MDYVSHTSEDQKVMLQEIGVSDFEELFSSVPADLRSADMDLPAGLSEMEVLRRMAEYAGRNVPSGAAKVFCGGGAYEHFIPAAVDELAGRSEFYTSYTPYQPERSQGTLQALYEYQTMICELTGMEVSNASLYDGATAVAEAALLAMAHTRRSKILVSGLLNPNYLKVLKTYLHNLDVEIVYISGTADGRTAIEALKKSVDDKTAAVIMPQPNFLGAVEDLEPAFAAAHKAGALAVANVYPIALGLIKPPGECGADIVVGEGQCLGNYVNFGGPYLGIMAATKKLVRRIPGRLCGITEDMESKRGFVLTLQTREQHIRRAKATSNICTNEGLLTVRAGIYMSLMGKEGFTELAKQNFNLAHYAFDKLTAVKNVSAPVTAPFFNEFVIRTSKPAADVYKALVDKGTVPGIPLERFYPDRKNDLLICVTETKTKSDIDGLANALEEVLS